MLDVKSALQCRDGLDLTFFFEALYLWPERSLSTTRTTSLAVMAFEHHEDNKLWHYMERLPRIMPENTLSPLLFFPLLSLSLFVFDSLFLSSSVRLNNKPAVSFQLPIPKHRLLVLQSWRGLRRTSLHQQS